MSSFGTNVTWTDAVSITFSSNRICLIASKNGKLSISPTVPPHSIIVISPPNFSEVDLILCFISSVIWGIIWTHWPKYFPLLSFRSTLSYICPVVKLCSLDKSMLRNLSYVPISISASYPSSKTKTSPWTNGFMVPASKFIYGSILIGHTLNPGKKYSGKIIVVDIGISYKFN